MQDQAPLVGERAAAAGTIRGELSLPLPLRPHALNRHRIRGWRRSAGPGALAALDGPVVRLNRPPAVVAKRSGCLSGTGTMMEGTKVRLDGGNRFDRANSLHCAR